MTPAAFFRLRSQIAIYDGVREILSCGGKAKSASKRRTKRRLTASNAREAVTEEGLVGGVGTKSSEPLADRACDVQEEGSGPPSQRQESVSSHPRDGGESTTTKAPAGGATPACANASAEGAGGTECMEVDEAVPESTGGQRGDTTAVSGSKRHQSSDNCGDDPFELLSPEKLSRYDIVLTTFEVLRAEVHHAESKFAHAHSGGGMSAAPSLRRRKRFVLRQC